MNDKYERGNVHYSISLFSDYERSESVVVGKSEYSKSACRGFDSHGWLYNRMKTLIINHVYNQFVCATDCLEIIVQLTELITLIKFKLTETGQIAFKFGLRYLLHK